MARKKKKLLPHPEWRQRRSMALDERAARGTAAKERDTFFTRYGEHEAVARILARRHGLDLVHARYIALSAPTSPMSSRGHRRKGRPPSGYELYEALEPIREMHGGELPAREGLAFWLSFTLQWNASNVEEHPERMYITEKGLPDWRALRTAYMTTARSLEAKAEVLYRSHKRCAACSRKA
jgi:hypothetical protein